MLLGRCQARKSASSCQNSVLWQRLWVVGFRMRVTAEQADGSEPRRAGRVYLCLSLGLIVSSRGGTGTVVRAGGPVCSVIYSSLKGLLLLKNRSSVTSGFSLFSNKPPFKDFKAEQSSLEV